MVLGPRVVREVLSQLGKVWQGWPCFSPRLASNILIAFSMELFIYSQRRVLWVVGSCCAIFCYLKEQVKDSTWNTRQMASAKGHFYLWSGLANFQGSDVLLIHTLSSWLGFPAHLPAPAYWKQGLSGEITGKRTPLPGDLMVIKTRSLTKSLNAQSSLVSLRTHFWED